MIKQSGQKFNIPAISGIAPKKNHSACSIAPNCTTPVMISAKPSVIRTTRQTDLILFTFMSIPLTFYKYFAIISILSKINPKVVKIAAIHKDRFNMKNFIYNEMMVHVALCTNKDPKSVLILSNDAANFVAEVQKHDGIDCDVVSADMGLLRDAKDAHYDVVISEMGSDAAVLAHINRVLKEDGLVVTTHPSLDNTADNKQMIGILGKYAKIVMPFNIGNGHTALLASKEYHPTADLILHRADMLDGLDYYNCDVHPAAFAMGNNIRKEYLGIIKN